LKYTQCLLSKYIDEGCIKHVAWIPEKFAKYNKVLKLKCDDNSWNDGWIVQEVYNSKDEKYIFEHERDWAKQRKASDI